MKSSKPQFEKYLFVCENERAEGACCGKRGSARLRERLKEAVSRQGMSRSVRVSRWGCLDVCSEGPNVLLMPDNVWFRQVSDADIPSILEQITGG